MHIARELKGVVDGMMWVLAGVDKKAAIGWSSAGHDSFILYINIHKYELEVGVEGLLGWLAGVERGGGGKGGGERERKRERKEERKPCARERERERESEGERRKASERASVRERDK